MTTNELKIASKEEHDALETTQVFTRVKANDYSPQQRKDVIQTKWVIRSRPRDKTKRLKARFIAKGYTQKVRDLCSNASSNHTQKATDIAQLRNHSVYV
eukprot:533938-Amphidinium_carterae.3